MTRIFLAILLFLFALPAFAQDTPDEERSYFLSFVENQLSGPNRQIRIRDIQGVLSSNATIGEITIADREGVWLRIVNARIDWTRRALLLGRLSIDTLGADRIEVLRQPVPDEALPSPEARPFQLPELPLSITLRNLEVPRVVFGRDVFGLAAELSVGGRLQLAEGSLDTALDITRLDGPGGHLTLAATYANATEQLNLDLTLSEPENGVVANLLGIEGRPPIALTVDGSGPISNLDVAISLDAASERVVTGTTRLRRQAEGLAFDANLRGAIARLIPARFRAFFGPETTLTAQGLSKEGGGFSLANLDLRSAALTVNAGAETSADGFLQQLRLRANIAGDGGQPVVLPVPGGETTVRTAALSVDFGTAGEQWTGTLSVDDLTTGTFAARAVALDLGGLAQNLAQPANRRITFDAEGAVSGIVAERADVAQALGEEIRLDVAGEWNAGQPIRLSNALVSGHALSLALSGDIAEAVFRGTIAIDAQSIAPFSQLAGRQLGGQMKLDASGEVAPVSGGFDLTLDGTAQGLRIGTPAADNLLKGETRITGRVARGEAGLTTDNLRIANEQVGLTADGTFATGAADFDFNLALSDLALVSDRASGRLTATGRAGGSGGLINLTMNTRVPTGTLVGKPLSDASLAFDGRLRDGNLDGMLTGSARLDNVPVELSSAIEVAENEKRLRGLSFSAGPTRISGDLTQTAAGLYEGQLRLSSQDISTAAALLLTEARGAIDANITLAAQAELQSAEISATVSGFSMEDVRVGRAELTASIADLFRVPAINGSVSASDVLAGGVNLATLQAEASRQGSITGFSGQATLANGTRAEAQGELAPVERGYRVQLQRATLAQGSLSARLIEPSAIAIRGETVTLDRLALEVGGGRLIAQGEIAEALNLDLSIEALPLSIANTVRPDVELGGTINGTARVSGSRSQPSISFDVTGRGIAAAALRQAGLTSVDVDATGTSTTDRLNVDASVRSPDGLNATVRGGVPLAGGTFDLDVGLSAFPLALLNTVVTGQDLGGMLAGTAKVTGTLAAPAATFELRGSGLRAALLVNAGLTPLEAELAGSFENRAVTLRTASARGPQGFSLSASGRVPLETGSIALDVTLNAFPLAILDRVAPGQDLHGSVTGTARVGGTLGNPSASFQLRGSGLSAAPLATAGIGPLQAEAAGTLRNRVIALSSASVRGPQGLSLTGSGSLPLSGGGVNVSLNGQAPLALANRFLAERGAEVSGTLSLNATVAGSLRESVIRGTFSTTGAQFVDPSTNVRLRGIAVSGSIDGETVTIRSASATLSSGGVLSAGGTISISAAAGFPADLRIVLNQARYTDGELVAATLNGSLSITGPLARDPLVSGTVDVARAEITVPESFGGGPKSIDVQHINPPPAVLRTLERARANDGTPVPGRRPSVARLDVQLNAPNQIFVRGRGLDAELGGSVRLTGPVSDIQPVGGFRLIRGRLAILGQRITFDEGTVTLVGDLDPFLNFVARSESRDITVFVTVSGRISELDVSFSSQPELPEDEVLARLIFKRGINELSPLQIAQLAAAAADLAGGSETSLLGNLREAVGLDELDIVTDSQGNAAVRAGTYIQENVYLGVEAGARGTTRGTINLDITEDLKARGSVGSDGDSSLGVFYEKDY